MVRDFPRRSVIVGSTNEDEFLADSTGNRRYWVVPVTRRIPIELLERERDQIWAAARTLYFGCGSAQVDANGAVIPKTGGEQWHLTDGEDKWQIKSVGQFQTDEIWSATIAKWLKNPRERETQASFEYVTTPLILLHAVGQELERLDRGGRPDGTDTP
jgi:predicted P-loop ATPase